MADKNKMAKEKEYVEKELSNLLEKTLQLENELMSVSDSE
jgi:hypothetical protein